MHRCAFLCLILLAATAASLAAEEVVLTPSRDNTVFSETEEGEKSNGSGDYLFTGRVANGALRRALIAFDVAKAIPAGSTVTSVLLTLTMTRTIVGSSPVELRLLEVDWGEGSSDAEAEEGNGAPAEPPDATWIHRFLGGEPWSREGGDLSPDVRDVQIVGGPGSYTWGSTAEMVRDVQSWLREPSLNFGWILVGSEGDENGGAATAKRYSSRENASDDFATVPTLTIEFTPAKG